MPAMHMKAQLHWHEVPSELLDDWSTHQNTFQHKDHMLYTSKAEGRGKENKKKIIIKTLLLIYVMVFVSNVNELKA